MLENLARGGVSALDVFLASEIERLRAEYQDGSRPATIYLAATALSQVVVGLAARHRSFHSARLQGLLGEMLLVQGLNAETLLKACDHFESALEIAEHVEG